VKWWEAKPIICREPDLEHAGRKPRICRSDTLTKKNKYKKFENYTEGTNPLKDWKYKKNKYKKFENCTEGTNPQKDWKYKKNNALLRAALTKSDE
jgi:hypothetical protein